MSHIIDKYSNYCASLTSYKRLASSEVTIGSLKLGVNHPIRVQSMTTTNTMDVEATVNQSIRMIEAGCELVRITVPSLKEADALKEIKTSLKSKGHSTPLVADIHFTRNAALKSAHIVEKVRINPGNFIDKKKFDQIVFSKKEYQEEIEKIRQAFIPLIELCKTYNTAIRIGANHGSLSDRIMSYYGDSPKGMVESVMEFLRICVQENFHQVVISMKSSNPKIMVQAYRLLISTMVKEKVCYPLHLGVTEAGEGEDGRIKSAVGIGTLLADGIGDTIRVSLTEEPEEEIPVAKALVEKYTNIKTDPIPNISSYPINPFEYKKRATHIINNIGGHHAPIVMADFALKKKVSKTDFASIGWQYLQQLDKWSFSDQSADYVFLNNNVIDFDTHESLGLVYDYNTWLTQKHILNAFPFFNLDSYIEHAEKHPSVNFLYLTLDSLDKKTIALLKTDKTIVLVIDSYNPNAFAEQRRLFIELMCQNITTPVIIGRAYKDLALSTLQLHASADLGGLLLDGLGDGIFIAAENCGSDESINQTGFGILQVCGNRISKTEYISCPSCGRTLFDLPATTAKIRAKTEHLKGLKIGIMGCIVNGPGEMADADYGYVGTGVGKITLYKQKEIIKKNIPEKDATDELIKLITHYGDWTEPITN